MKGGINLHMLPSNTQESHCVCLNLPLEIETVHRVENNTQFLHFTDGGEGGCNSLAAMGDDGD